MPTVSEERKFERTKPYELVEKGIFRDTFGQCIEIFKSLGAHEGSQVTVWRAVVTQASPEGIILIVLDVGAVGHRRHLPPTFHKVVWKEPS